MRDFEDIQSSDASYPDFDIPDGYTPWNWQPWTHYDVISRTTYDQHGQFAFSSDSTAVMSGQRPQALKRFPGACVIELICVSTNTGLMGVML